MFWSKKKSKNHQKEKPKRKKRGTKKWSLLCMLFEHSWSGMVCRRCGIHYEPKK